MLTSGPVWYLMRASGVVSLLLLTLVVALGVAASNRWKPGRYPRFVTNSLHRNAALLSVVFLAVHVVTAVIDPDAGVRLLAVVLPLGGGGSAIWLGLGALSLDLVAALVVSSLIRRRLGYRLWRAIHLSAYAAWPLGLLHGFGLGTDTPAVWMTAVNVACVAAVAAAAAWRLSAHSQPNRRTVSARTGLLGDVNHEPQGGNRCPSPL